MYSIPAIFALDPHEESEQDGGLLLFFSSCSEEQLRSAAVSRTAFCAAPSIENPEEVIVCDDGGNAVVRYRSAHSPGKTEKASSAFSVFRVCDFLCGLSAGWDLLLPEHSRLLVLSGIDLLCIFPPAALFDSFPLHEFARVRAAENQVFVSLFDPCRGDCFCWGPAGTAVPFQMDGTEKFFRLHRSEIFLERKRTPLLSLRKKQLYHAVTIL